MRKYITITSLLISVLFFFRPVFLNNLLPIPSDTIVGLYHPFRDAYIDEYPRGLPFKNFLITDPVRQQYPWRELAISGLKNLELPLWNPYSFSGTPLLANLQSAALYPLNFIFILLPFPSGWSLLIVLQSLLSSLFVYLFLRNLKISKAPSFLGGLTFAFCGFSVAWLQWGSVLHSALWLPLALLSIDKLFDEREKKIFLWPLVLFLSVTFSFLAGHLQIFFYFILTAISYTLFRFYQTKNRKKLVAAFVAFLSSFILTTPLWISALNLILFSGREVDQSLWQKEGWFIPWQNAVQFLSPDFFGNPTTLNYWGVFNYAEFVGYIGILPLIFVIYSLFFIKNKTILFFLLVSLVSFIFAFPTFLAKLPYILDIPFISTSQPTRLLFLIGFSFSVLSAFGFEEFVKNKDKRIFLPVLLLFLFLGILWLAAVLGAQFGIDSGNLLVARRNLILPSILTFPSALFFVRKMTLFSS